LSCFVNKKIKKQNAYHKQGNNFSAALSFWQNNFPDRATKKQLVLARNDFYFKRYVTSLALHGEYSPFSLSA
jgi:hypothetical protein